MRKWIYIHNHFDHSFMWESYFRHSIMWESYLPPHRSVALRKALSACNLPESKALSVQFLQANSALFPVISVL